MAVSKQHFPLARGARSSSGHTAPERSCHRGATEVLDSHSENVVLLHFHWQLTSASGTDDLGADSPVLVEPTLALVTDVLGEDGFEGTQATGGVDVTHDSDHNHRRGLDDGHGLDDFFFVHLCTRGKTKKLLIEKLPSLNVCI